MPVKHELNVTIEEGSVYFSCRQRVEGFNGDASRYAEAVASQTWVRRAATSELGEDG